MRWIEREGVRVLQQVWIKSYYTDNYKWENAGEHRWEDVPLEPDDMTFWTRYE